MGSSDQRAGTGRASIEGGLRYLIPRCDCCRAFQTRRCSLLNLLCTEQNLTSHERLNGQDYHFPGDYLTVMEHQLWKTMR